MQAIRTLLDGLKDGQILYFRIQPEDYEAFYEECTKAGIHDFFTGGPFNRNDVRSLMSIDKKHTVGYVSALCFFGSINTTNSMNLDEKPVQIIHVDYGKLSRGKDYLINADHAPLMNNNPLNGKVLILESDD